MLRCMLTMERFVIGWLTGKNAFCRLMRVGCDSEVGQSDEEEQR